MTSERNHVAPDASAEPAILRPVRTCIGCRRRGWRGQMVRIVAESVDVARPRVIVDEAAVLPGRGAWVHVLCIERAVRGRAVSRALHMAGDADTDPLRSYVDAASARATVLDRREGSGIEADGHPMSTQR